MLIPENHVVYRSTVNTYTRYTSTSVREHDTPPDRVSLLSLVLMRKVERTCVHICRLLHGPAQAIAAPTTAAASGATLCSCCCATPEALLCKQTNKKLLLFYCSVLSPLCCFQGGRMRYFLLRPLMAASCVHFILSSDEYCFTYARAGTRGANSSVRHTWYIIYMPCPTYSTFARPQQGYYTAWTVLRRVQVPFLASPAYSSIMTTSPVTPKKKKII